MRALGGERWFISMFSSKLIWYGDGSCTTEMVPSQETAETYAPLAQRLHSACTDLKP